MAVKHFLVNPKISHLSKKDISELEQLNSEKWQHILAKKEELNNELLTQKHTLKAPEGKVIIQIDITYKNFHTFANGQKIIYERDFDNFNRRYTQPVNAIVIDAKNIPQGSEILIHPNAVADHHQIHNYHQLSGKEISSDIKYYSIPEDMCFIWRDGENWLPLPPYETALRIFIPYDGVITGIEPKQIKDALYCTSGELKGKALATIKAVDYEVIFRNTKGVEQRIIRWRPFGDKRNNREEEAIAILNDVTKKIKNNQYYIGLSTTDSKPLNQYFNA